MSESSSDLDTVDFEEADPNSFVPEPPPTLPVAGRRPLRGFWVPSELNTAVRRDSNRPIRDFARVSTGFGWSVPYTAEFNNDYIERNDPNREQRLFEDRELWLAYREAGQLPTVAHNAFDAGIYNSYASRIQANWRLRRIRQELRNDPLPRGAFREWVANRRERHPDAPLGDVDREFWQQQQRLQHWRAYRNEYRMGDAMADMNNLRRATDPVRSDPIPSLLDRLPADPARQVMSYLSPHSVNGPMVANEPNNTGYDMAIRRYNSEMRRHQHNRLVGRTDRPYVPYDERSSEHFQEADEANLRYRHNLRQRNPADRVRERERRYREFPNDYFKRDL